MGGKSIVVFLLFVVFVLVFTQVVFAVETEIVVKTSNPIHGLVIRVLDPATFKVIDNIYSETGPDGQAFLPYLTERDVLAFEVLVVRGGEIVDSAKFEERETSGNIYLDFEDPERLESEEVSENEIVETAEENPQETEQETENQNMTGETEQQKSEGITGSAIVGKQESLSGIVYYIVGAVFLAGVVGLILFRKSKQSFSGNSKSMPKQEKPIQPVKNFANPSEELADAEKKIQEAQEEIRRLKDREKQQTELAEAQKRFEQAKADLERLKG